MKTLSKLFIIVSLISCSLIACSDGHDHDHDHNGHDKENATAEQDGPEYTSAYVCPMHCKGSGSDQPGNCLPVSEGGCEMKLIKNPDFEEAPGSETDTADTAS